MIRYMAAVLRWSILSVSFALALAACSGEPDLVPNTPEKDFVQTGMDAMMAEREVTSVTPNTRSTNSWIDNPTGTTTAPLYPTYMRSPSTDCFYCWDSTGKVTRQDKSSAACARPAAGSFAEPMCVIERGEWGGRSLLQLESLLELLRTARDFGGSRARAACRCVLVVQAPTQGVARQGIVRYKSGDEAPTVGLQGRSDDLLD